MPFHVTGVAILSLVMTEYETQKWQLVQDQATYLPSFIPGQPAALDVTITSPLQVSLISDAARTCGFALTLAENRKIGHF